MHFSLWMWRYIVFNGAKKRERGLAMYKHVHAHDAVA